MASMRTSASPLGEGLFSADHPQGFPWDVDQLAILNNLKLGKHMGILGGPASGRTAVLIEAARRLATGMGSDSGSGLGTGEERARVLVLASSRRAAAALHSRLAHVMPTIGENLAVRSYTSACYSIVHSYSQEHMRPTPELISGPIEDYILKELLEAECSRGMDPSWSMKEEGLASPVFRAELRAFITRAREHGLNGTDLADLTRAYGQELNVKAWKPAGRVLDEYQRFLAAQDAFAPGADRLDHASLIQAATAMYTHWDDFEGEGALLGRGIERPYWDWVLVDDTENAPYSLFGFLHALAEAGSTVIAASNPDTGTEGFRGANRGFLADFCDPHSPFAATVYTLHGSYAIPKQIRSLMDHLTEHIEVTRGLIAHRHVPSDTENDGITDKNVEIHGHAQVSAAENLGAAEQGVHAHEAEILQAQALRTPDDEATFIAHYIHKKILDSRNARRSVTGEHSQENRAAQRLNLSDFLILTRSRSQHYELRRALMKRGIPVAHVGLDIPLCEHPTIASFLDAVEIVFSLKKARIRELIDMLCGPYFMLSESDIRREVRLMEAIARVEGSLRTEEELLGLVLADEATVDRASRGYSVALKAAARKIEQIRKQPTQRGIDAAWALWESSGCAQRWRERALNGDSEADQSLDLMIQFFTTATRLTTRDPELSLRSLVNYVKEQSLPEDSLVGASRREDAVRLGTASSTLGQSALHVIIAGLNDAIWPNMTVRSPLLKVDLLTSIVTGSYISGLSANDRYELAYHELYSDELRLLLASLSRSRSTVLLTCVDGEAGVPSRMFDVMGFVQEKILVAGEPVPELCVKAPIEPAEPARAVRLVGRLRQVIDPASRASVEIRQQAHALLDQLKAEGYREADPEKWIDAFRPLSYPPDEDVVQINPSSAYKIIQCPLRGVMEQLGFRKEFAGISADVGTMVHLVAQEHPLGSYEELVEAFEQLWQQKFASSADTLEMWKAHDKALKSIKRLAEFFEQQIASGITESEIGVEEFHAVCVDNGQARVVARIDRIVRSRDGEITVFDYKTGAVKNDGSAETQIRIYRWLVTQTEGSEDVVAMLVSLGRKEGSFDCLVAEPEETYDAKVEEILIALSDILHAPSLLAHFGPECFRCSFSHICPARSTGRMYS